jgi:hypothetical protein
MRYESIPDMGSAPEGAPKSRVRAMIAELPASRRNLMKGLAVTAMAATLVPMDWALSRRRAVAGPTSEFTGANCDPPYSGGYGEERNNWWGDGRAVCFGGWRMGSYPCSGGFHFEGSRTHRPGASDQERYTNVVRLTTCGGRNAWRWSNNTWRCSDAMTTVTWRDGTYHRDLTIAMCRV